MGLDTRNAAARIHIAQRTSRDNCILSNTPLCDALRNGCGLWGHDDECDSRSRWRLSRRLLRVVTFASPLTAFIR